MSVKPILFSTEMVRAILAGRKTVTRRKIPLDIVNRCDIETDGKTLLTYENEYGDFIEPELLCRYHPGDILYVRETWAPWSRTEGLAPTIHYKADGENLPNVKWRPSIHMPREAARIWLRVTDVRVERLLQCGTDAQARAEGFPCVTELLRLWNSTIKPWDRERYGWAANPWVWVIEFERCDKPEV